jgi:hypothetical protein
MATSSSASGSVGSSTSKKSASRNIIGIAFVLISALYFADTLLRATLKTFWYDELVTVYLCRLPSFHATWAAVLQGGDLNPPLFYLLTRWSQHFTGEGLIASRLPAILGFWIFSICIYAFVARRLGRPCGLIAALLPWFTLAHYYAYEARPHGALLAWCGVMLVCWQRSRGKAQDDSSAPTWPPNLWHLGLFLVFLAGLLTHVYAAYLVVPFLLVECDNLFRHRPVQLGACLAMLLPLPIVAPVYLRLTRHYFSGVVGGGLHIHPYEVVQHYLVAVFGPGLVLVVILLALLAWRNRSRDSSVIASMNREELVLALGLVILPILGVITAKLTHGPYFDRYFLVTAAGYAIFLAQVIAMWGPRSFAARALVAIMVFFVAADTLIAAYCHWRHADIDQVEPSSHIVFVPDPANPFMRNGSLLEDHSQRDILITDHPDYLFLEYYASPELRRRLYFAAPEANNMFLHSYQQLTRLAGAGLQATTLHDFFATHRDFLMYQEDQEICVKCAEQTLAAGYILRDIQPDIDGELQHFSK